MAPKYPYQAPRVPLNDFRTDIVKFQEDVEDDIRRVEEGLTGVSNYIGSKAYAEIVDSARLTWKEPVEAFADLATKYPAPEKGDTAQTKTDGKVYRYNGAEWSLIQQIDAGPVNEVDARLSGLLAEKANKTDLEATSVKSLLMKRISDGVKSVVPFPSGFEWTDAPINIYKDKIGGITTDFDVAVFKPTTVKTYYVDMVNGHASNDGLTPETAFNAPYYAYNAPEESIEIRLATGLYKRVHLYKSGSLLRDKNVVIKPMNENDEVVLSMHDDHNTLAYTLHTGSTYKVTRSSVSRVFDAKFIDDYGDYLELVKRNSITEVNANPNSFYIEGSVIYLQMKDSRQPDEYVRPYFNNLSPIDYESSTHKLYLEDLKIEGGQNVVWAKSRGGSATTSGIYAKNCEFKYSSSISLDLMDVDGMKYAFFQNCIVSNGKKDGYGYHKDNGSAVHSIEVDCIGRFNGSAENSGDTDNGSTQHNGGKAIRVNSQYYGNKGSNIGDTHVGTQSWNLGCIGYDSSAPIEDKYNCNFSAHADSEMWIDASLSITSTYGLRVQDKATAYLRQFAIEGEIVTEGTGRVVNY